MLFVNEKKIGIEPGDNLALSRDNSKGDNVLLVDEFETPVGTLVLAARNGRLCALEFKDADQVSLSRLKTQFTLCSTHDPFGFSTAIKKYFDGDATAMDSIPVEPAGTMFQRQVWLALRDIPLGTTLSYGQLAARVGSPKACRAVGITNGRNPIVIVLPCHRVIGSNGTLTGYGGGLARKEWLLRHEEALRARLFSARRALHEPHP